MIVSNSSQVAASLLQAFLIDFGIQFIFYIMSALLKTEKFYDLSGALTYQACIIASLFWRNDSISSLAPRQIIVATLVFIWCTRLGGFLFVRVLQVEDKRFDNLKKSPIQFAIPWILQVIWIFFTAFGAFVVIGNPTASQSNLIWSDYIGIIIWVFGFLVEVIADTQKFIFKAKNPRDFITTGIWAYSRYANYNGEITLWVGMWILCAAGFSEGWQWVSILSPVFVACLIIFVSGIALSEVNAEKRYGNRQDYRNYKARTSKFFLWPPKSLPVSSDSSAEASV